MYAQNHSHPFFRLNDVAGAMSVSDAVTNVQTSDRLLKKGNSCHRLRGARKRSKTLLGS